MVNPKDAAVVRRQISERAGNLKNGFSQIVELGCGSGWLGCSLAVSGFAGEIISVDISLGMLKGARETAKLNGIRANQIKADAARLPFADESIEFICGGGFLHHLDDEEQFFMEVRRVLKPGGLLLIFREPQAFGSVFVSVVTRMVVFIPGLAFKLIKRNKETFDHELEKSYSKKRLSELGDSSGMEMIACNAHSFLHTVHWQVAYKVKSVKSLQRFVNLFQPVVDFIDKKILAHILPSMFFYEISACFRK